MPADDGVIGQTPIVPSLSSKETNLTIQSKQRTTSPTTVMGFGHSRQLDAEASASMDWKSDTSDGSCINDPPKVGAEPKVANTKVRDPTSKMKSTAPRAAPQTARAAC